MLNRSKSRYIVSEVVLELILYRRPRIAMQRHSGYNMLWFTTRNLIIMTTSYVFVVDKDTPSMCLINEECKQF